MTETIFAAWHATSALELVSVTFGLAYILLAARESLWCWPAALINTATAIVLFWDASLLMESALNIYYLLMAGYGWWYWRFGGVSDDDKAALAISRWGWADHAKALVIILLLTVSSGYLLAATSSAALPFVDSFTSWSAVIATWMVARKILQNWLYWIVIDTVSIWLFVQRGLYAYALLFVLYTIIAVYGYWQWRRSYLHVHQQNL